MFRYAPGPFARGADGRRPAIADLTSTAFLSPPSRHVVLATTLLLLVSVVVASANPGPIGPEYPADERELPPRGWWDQCSNAHGVTIRIVARCATDACDGKMDLFVERTDANGTALGEPVRVNEQPALSTGHRVTCSLSGPFVVQWRDGTEGCYAQRPFGGDGDPLGPPALARDATGECSSRPSVAVARNGTYLVIWRAGSWNHTDVVALPMGVDGQPSGERVVVSTNGSVSNENPKALTDGAGITLVVWLEEPSALEARFLGAGHDPLGAQFVVSRPAVGVVEQPAIVSLGAGQFEVLWRNPVLGGRVGRRVSIVPATVTSSTTTTTLAELDDLPRFGAARVIDSFDASSTQTRPHRAHSGGAGAWMVEQRRGDYRLTTDDGATWSGWMHAGGDDSAVVAVGSDGEHGWVALLDNQGDGRLEVSRSLDPAASWSPAAVLTDPSSRCETCGLGRAAVAGDSDGSWLAAWTVSGNASSAWSDDDGSYARIEVARSGDGGRTWSAPRVVATDAGSGRAGFDLATDGEGTWVVVWGDGELRASRSTDGGRSWSEPRVLVSELACLSCPKQSRYSQIDLATDGDGAWVLTFASPTVDPGRYGHDGDVFIVRSEDGAASWSEAASVASYAETDGARDVEPSIATDGSGRWLTAWTSHRPFGPSDGLDADVVVALSTDSGRSWSPPRLFEAGSTDDQVMEWRPRLAADRRGTWMSVWQSRSFQAPAGDRVLVAAADASCGNGAVEPGEQCDDANLTDDDGCDSNCTTSGCGNAIVNEHEGCDDGNDRDHDACPNDCLYAVCGDGITQTGREECDFADPEVADICSEDCKIVGICGDTNADDWTSVRDVLRILQSGAGMSEVCPRATCDMDGNGRISAPDAQIGIRKAIGLADDGQCQIGTGTIVFWLADTRKLGSLQFDVHYADTGGRFLGSGSGAACEVGSFAFGGEVAGAQEALADINNRQDLGVLTMAFIHARGFSGPIELARCAFELQGETAAAPFVIRVTDSATPELDPIWPPVRVGYRLEVGDDVPVESPPTEPPAGGDGSTSIVEIELLDPITLGALQVVVDYGNADGEFRGSGADYAAGGTLECTSPLPDSFASFNDCDRGGDCPPIADHQLSAAFVSLAGFSGPTVVGRCSFDSNGGPPSPEDFSVAVTDASNTALQPVVPLPSVAINVVSFE